MKALQEHKQELIKNLTTDGWKAKEVKLDYKDKLYCVRAKKRFYFVFKRIHIYILIKEVDDDNFKEIIDLVKNNFYNYHTIWLAADNFSQEVKKYAKDTEQIGLIKIEVK